MAIATARAGAATELWDVDDSYEADVKRLIGFFCAHGVDRFESEDLAHETVLRRLVHLKRHGRTQEHLGPLTKTIARNLLVERRRKAAKATVVPLQDHHEIADDALDPFEVASAAERRDAVRRAVRALPARHRGVVTSWMAGHTPNEIARELGIKRNAVDAILHRARRGLASRLGPRALWGVIGFVAFKARAGYRNSMRSVASFMPATPGVADAGVSLVTVAVAAMITLASPAISSAPHASVNADKIPVAKTTVPHDAADSARAVRDGAVEMRPPQPVRTRNTVEKGYEVGGRKQIDNPTTGKKDDAGLIVWYEYDEDDPSPLDPVLRRASGIVEGR